MAIQPVKNIRTAACKLYSLDEVDPVAMREAVKRDFIRVAKQEYPNSKSTPQKSVLLGAISGLFKK